MSRWRTRSVALAAASSPSSRSSFKELSSLLVLPDHGISHILHEVTLEPLTIIKDSQHLAFHDLVLSVESSDAPWYAAVDGGVISPLPDVDGLHVPDFVGVGQFTSLWLTSCYL